MPKLNHTTVKRSGVTSSKWTEVQNLRKDFSVWRPYHVPHGVNNFHERTFIKGKEYLSIDIEINAAGGGFTELFIKIGIDEFPAIFELIAKEIPHTAPIFSKCTTIAINNMRQDPSELVEDYLD